MLKPTAHPSPSPSPSSSLLPHPTTQITSDEESAAPSKLDGMVEYQACCNFRDIRNPLTQDACILGRLFYDRKNKTITMVNSNTCLGRRVFLLGQSEKPQRKEVIGQFGETLVAIPRDPLNGT